MIEILAIDYGWKMSPHKMSPHKRGPHKKRFVIELLSYWFYLSSGFKHLLHGPQSHPGKNKIQGQKLN